MCINSYIYIYIYIYSYSYLLTYLLIYLLGRGSVVGIATCNRLDVSGIESRGRGEIFPTFQTSSESHPAYYTMDTGSFPGVKSGRVVALTPTSSSAEVKERLELYISSPSGPSWPVLGWTVSFTLSVGDVNTLYHKKTKQYSILLP
jgi:hypothetical protein